MVRSNIIPCGVDGEIVSVGCVSDSGSIVTAQLPDNNCCEQNILLKNTRTDFYITLRECTDTVLTKRPAWCRDSIIVCHPQCYGESRLTVSI